jgi:hypothetical protein
MIKRFFIWAIFLCIMVILVDISCAKEDDWQSYKVNGKYEYKIKILPVLENGNAELKNKDQVLIIVHGIRFLGIGGAKAISEDFARGFAQIVGADKVVLFEYAPDHFYPGDLTAKWSNNVAGFELADLTANIIENTGEEPVIYCHSNGNSICIDASRFIQGKESIFPILKPTDKMKKARWKLAMMASAHASRDEKLEDMENSIIGRTSNGDVSLYVLYSKTDVVASDGLRRSNAKHIEFDILSYLKQEKKGIFALGMLGIWTHMQWMTSELLPLYKEKLDGEKLSSITSSKKETSTPTSIPPLPAITPIPTDTRPPYPVPTNIPPPWDDGNGGNSLGGVDFTDVSINSISSNMSAEQIGKFGYTFKAKKANVGDKIINIEDATELSLSSFFVGLTIPKSEFWVNLNLWEPDRIIEKDLETTDVGRIMLESDLRMKKNFGKYEDPCQSEIGTKYWELLEQKRDELITNVMRKYPDDIKDVKNVQFAPVTRYWIVPDKMDIYETDDEIYIIDATMNISSEPVYEHSKYQIVNQDTIFMSEGSKDELDDASKEYGRYVKELEEKMLLPLVVQDINKNYSDLMKIYISLALSQLYKDRYRSTNSPFADFIDSKDLKGLESRSTWNVEDVWKDYKKSFEKGDYNCWKNETYKQGDYTVTSSKLYIGGGVDFTNIKITDKGEIPENLKGLISDAKFSSFIKTADDYYFGDELYFWRSGDNGIVNSVKDETINSINKEKLPQETQNVSGFTIIFGILAIMIMYVVRR